MPRYIEFAPDPSDPGLLGNPVYIGSFDPGAEFEGIRVNGEELTLLNNGLVDNLHRTLVDGPKLARRDGSGFDCVTFALLMCNVNLVQAVGKKKFSVKSETDELA